MNTKRLFLSALIGLALLVAVVLIDSWAFGHWLSTDYLTWYIHSGALISLGFAFVTLAWGDLNKIKGLVSAHPFLYISACLYLVGLPIYVFGSILRRPQRQLMPRARHPIGAGALEHVVARRPNADGFVRCNRRRGLRRLIDRQRFGVVDRRCTGSILCLLDLRRARAFDAPIAPPGDFKI